jgi:hypothetical protein
VVRDTVPSGTPRPDLTAGFCAAKMGDWLVRQKAYAYDFQNALRKTMTGTARRQAKAGEDSLNRFGIERSRCRGVSGKVA